ncbi:putative zinc fyve domain containing protein [Diaporthe ampelina]|uniref:Putative zinc fyve domain containing protein n=1 Tax=Diaporthe ampelina TaxID=1214573 RepID=A0A0G2FDH5_9PEZI|nr:putative zinc fyve domain containing protein [Diaporthe ampelina]
MAHSSDKSLLERLNALKPTSVNLDRSTKEDALSERLRSLRNRRDHLESSESGDPPPPYTASPATRAQPPPSTSAWATGPASPGNETGRHRSGGDDEAAEGGSQSSGEYDHYFDDVLQPLDLDDDGGGSGSDGGGDEGSSKRVEDLLAKLKADPGAQPPLPAESKPDSSKAKDVSSDDDDSEGELMSREVEHVISRALDELKLDGSASQPAEPDATASPGGEPKADDGEGGRARAPASRDDDGHELALPTVPQDAADDREQKSSPKPWQPGGNDGGSDGKAGLNLPAVPTKLVDPAPTSGAVPSGGDRFESSIAARLAALKGAGAPIIHTDALGLPSAPTFRPEDNRPAPKKLGRGGPRAGGGYTDADQKTWCIVCLEDGTVRCLGCDDDGDGGGDVYCARCWKEMHVGPSAGYDERGHAWERFDPRRV